MLKKIALQVSALLLGCALVASAAWAQVSWHANNFYRKGAVVVENGVAYIALNNSLNKPPAVSPQFWVERSKFDPSAQSIGIQQAQTPFGYSQQMNMGVAQTPNQANAAPQVEGWDDKKIYTKGRVVSYDGAIWRASYWSQGEAPGSSEAWSPTTTTKWSPHVAYVKGQSVIYNGIAYIAQWWTKGDIPLNDKTGAWQPSQGGTPDLNPNNRGLPAQSVTNGNNNTIAANPIINSSNPNQYAAITQKLDINSHSAWRADFSYAPNAIVSYEGAVWRKTGTIDSRKAPPEEGQWTPLTLTKWYPNVVYSKGMTVLVAGEIWYSQWINSNIYPKTDSTGVWIQVDENGNRVFTSEKSVYSNTHVYVKGDKCMYDGISWLSSYWNQNEAPGTTQAWVPMGLTRWYSEVAYDPREAASYRSRVVYKGIEWQALWWTKGDTPSLSPVWKPLSVTDWIAALAYNGSDEVIYDGARWRAQWWTQSEEPSKFEVWLPLTVSNWYATRAYSQGQTVNYQKTTWVALYWTKGEVPGQSPAWQKKT